MIRTDQLGQSSTGRNLLRRSRFLIAAVLLFGVPNGALAAASPWVGDEHAASRLVTSVQATGSGSVIDAGLEIRMAPGWHAYWRTPGDAGLAPTIDWMGSTNLAQAVIAWPAPTRLSVEGLETFVYPDHALLPIAATLSDPGRPLALRGSVDYAACAEVCVPYHADLLLTLPAGFATPGDEAPLIAAARAKVPGGLIGARLTLLSAWAVPMGDKGALLNLELRSADAPLRQPDLFIEGLSRGQAGRPEMALTDNRRTVALAVQIWGSTASALAATSLTFTLTDGTERAAEFAAMPTLATTANAGTR